MMLGAEAAAVASAAAERGPLLDERNMLTTSSVRWKWATTRSEVTVENVGEDGEVGAP